MASSPLQDAILQSLQSSNPGKSERWLSDQIQMAQQAAQAGLPAVSLSSQESPARLRLIDALGRANATGLKIPQFTGMPNEPLGDRASAMDITGLIKGLRILESQAANAGDQDALLKIGMERAYWENEAKQGMTAEEWMQQTGEPDLVYPAQ